MIKDFIEDAKELGEEHAKAAAGWIVDGNTDLASAERLLGMLRDGDPAAEQYLPKQPNLSGEYAEDLTPAALYREIVGDHIFIDMEPERFETLTTELCDAYETGGDVFGVCCEKTLEKFCHTDKGGQDD